MRRRRNAAFGVRLKLHHFRQVEILQPGHQHAERAGTRGRRLLRIDAKLGITSVEVEQTERTPRDGAVIQKRGRSRLKRASDHEHTGMSVCRGGVARIGRTNLEQNPDADRKRERIGDREANATALLEELIDTVGFVVVLSRHARRLLPFVVRANPRELDAVSDIHPHAAVNGDRE